MKYEAVIGLEVHTQVRTRTKMFCGCPNRFGADANTCVCPICLGYPGVLPVMNREAIRKTLLAGLACGCNLASHSKFDRKSYYYPDMPKNYQISQYDLPLCSGGRIPIGGNGFSGNDLPEKAIGLTRIHLEEDVAKSTHLGKHSAVDFNRAGVPLMEIVSEPDMRSPDEAYAYLTTLKQVLEYADVSDCDMEKGQMRCDVNVSVRPVGQKTLGTKIEIKNLNSFRAVHRSLVYEIERQIEEVEDGITLQQETRRWDDEAGMTVVMRTKEHAHDYRYLPEPDLLPVEIDAALVDKLRTQIPEAPHARRTRLTAEYGITDYDAEVLTQDRKLADYFETAARAVKTPKTIANWIQTQLLAALAATERTIEESPVSPNALAELIGLVENNTISGRIAKDVFADMLETGDAPAEIVERKGLRQVTDSGAIEEFVAAAIADNPHAVEEYRAGKKKAIQFLVGQVMKRSRGKANPHVVVQLLKDHLA